ncbi:unnamed protein product [Medioppia subpectinata]|uniref:Phosphoenolpyruvate synthase n=1 Tax=Medioppia subpectinata TaxID=1979941 RepID=A0A7R9KTG1_9ACAR|nr:unnamed protein product [Medioppia subpectinata]CAG2109509.1 unnamed protein product [Medioppia subpectinata]
MGFYAIDYNKRGRLDIHDPDVEGDPYAIGLLPQHPEWQYECPNKNRSENLLIYGTNTWGQYLIIEIKWRPQKNHKISANVRLIFRDENQLIYELNENDLLTIETIGDIKQYRIVGLSVEVLAPFRKLRIKFRGYLRNRETNELIFSRFSLFWCPLSNVFDFQNDFDRKYIAKELSSLGIKQLIEEERHEQWGQLVGSVQFDTQLSKQLFLWGNKSKQYVNSWDNRKVTRIYGFSCKSFAFHVGALRSPLNYRVRYGYVSLGVGTVYPISSLSCPFNEIESIGESFTKFKLEVGEQNRVFEIEIEKAYERYDNILICELKLNGQKGKCLVFIEEFNGEDVINPYNKELPVNELSDLVLTISDPKAKTVGLSGGKGASLAALIQLSNSCDNKSEMREGMQTCCQKVSENFAKQKLPQDLKDKIKENLIENFGYNFESIRFAVRSSALSEDSEEMSSAGQMTTILGVKGIDNISDAVMKCWSSQFEFVAVEYKRGYGQEINSPMAVVIQEMVDCQSAGVIFTCDPLTGDERNVIITGNYGIGESVVSAAAEPDTIRLNVNIETNSLLNKRSIADIQSIDIGSKLKSIMLNDNNESGTIEVNTVHSDECCLTESQCKSLGEVSLEVHRFYGNPRDIEWGIIGDEIYLLQSRPITNLNNWSDWEAMHEMDSGQQSESEYYSRANLGEVFPGASSHLCLSWVVTRYWRKMMDLPKKEFCVYYNRGGGIVNNHYFFLLKTGTFPFVGDARSRISKCIQIGMFGHEFGDEYNDLIADSNEKAPKKSMSLLTKLWLFFGSFVYFLTPGKSIRAAVKDLKNLDLFEGKSTFTAKDVFNALLKTAHLSGAIAYAHGKATICSMVYNVVLLDILKKNNNDNNEANTYSDFGQLVSSANQVVSAQVPNLLRDIAVSIENRQQFRQMSDEKALKYLLHSDTKASIKFKQFLLDYGHRGYKEFDVMTLQWADNPISVIKSLKTMLSGDQTLQTKSEKTIDETLSSLKTKLTFSQKLLLKYLVIPWCKSGISWREKSKHEITRNYNIFRRGFWRLAKMMVSEGRLPEPDLLFHMSLAEVHSLFAERDPTIIARARLRKRVHSIQETMNYDETTIGPDIQPRNENFDTRSDLLSEGMARIKGTPVSAGKTKGRCCVAMTLAEAQNIRSGDILITYSTDIGWSPYFPMLSGLATEIGGLISHGAVIAREYGLPCLVGVDGAHRLFKTGDQIVIDTEIGEIYKIV